MIVLDTNVVSEPLRPRPDPRVIHWLSALSDDVALTAVGVGELLLGVELLPAGRRRELLAHDVASTLSGYAEQVLAYDEPAAHIYAELQARSRRDGRALTTEDGMIAAICVRWGATLATRNVKDFEGLGLSATNPWNSD